MRTQLERIPGARAGSSCPTFTLETPEDYALACQRIHVLKGGTQDDAEEAELKGLEAAVHEVDFPPRNSTKNNQIG